jgi:acyl-CoA dehydrogenase
LKRKESLSARLGDILSHLYLLSAALKHYHDQGEKLDDYPLVRYAGNYCLYQIQESFNDFIINFPNRVIGGVLRILVFPLGRHITRPKDRLNRKISQLLMEPSDARTRLTEGAYTTNHEGNIMATVQDALVKTIAAEPIEKVLKDAYNAGTISGYSRDEQAKSALEKNIITSDMYSIYMQADEARRRVIAVDDFSNEELERTITKDAPFYAKLFVK